MLESILYDTVKFLSAFCNTELQYEHLADTKSQSRWNKTTPVKYKCIKLPKGHDQSELYIFSRTYRGIYLKIPIKTLCSNSSLISPPLQSWKSGL